MTKYIFFIGGVLSGIGKGISAASLGAVLKARGIQIDIIKLDPYLNTSAGLMSPIEHGEVFVTQDGIETDMDLGHYQRFLNQNISGKNNITAGQIYKSILDKEQKGEYLGQTIQVVPHVIYQIINSITDIGQHTQTVIIEIGGTIGDLEAGPFYEAARRIIQNNKAIAILVAPLLKIKDQQKTKAIQHAIHKIQSLGIIPNILILRSPCDINTDNAKQKIEYTCGIKKEDIFNAYDTDNILTVPIMFYSQGLDLSVIKKLDIDNFKTCNMDPWYTINQDTSNFKQITIGILNKYKFPKESYISLIEAVKHSGLYNKVITKINFIETSDDIDKIKTQIESCDGLIIPGSFGARNIDKNIYAASLCRKIQKPMLGICMGFQSIMIEICRNDLNIENANSQEFIEDDNCVIHKSNIFMLGAKKITLKDDTFIFQAYNKKQIQERFRNRYIWNCKYTNMLENVKDFRISAMLEDNTIVGIEHISHPFYVGVQYHPEFSSNSIITNPIIDAFINAIKKQLFL